MIIISEDRWMANEEKCEIKMRKRKSGTAEEGINNKKRGKRLACWIGKEMALKCFPIKSNAMTGRKRR